ncbi:MAG: ribbon-helix-helix protein, CopG family [Myxococcales bacterium]|nr:ribbon-helix-helix protein, CopG family [Myxococcales bacterium]MCB9519792.1 ribbon-helix-helix protein, CopG family [Myxococcales bacterium]
MTRKKDRVLNTRIPEQLDRELREHAARLDVSVSELVRDVLGRTVDLVGNLSGNVESLVADIVEDVSELRRAGTTARAARAAAVREIERDVVGWREVTVERPTRCALTGVELATGATAHLAIRLDGRPGVTISPDALASLLQPESEWVALVAQQPGACALTGAPYAKGDAIWFDPRARPPRFISSAAHDRLVAGESEAAVSRTLPSGGES